ncbi:quinon protein alcohol dehydrogenase-like superfamily, partial [Blyttiomyces helicus]
MGQDVSKQAALPPAVPTNLPPESVIFVGCAGHVLAFDKRTGLESWRTRLPHPTSTRPVSLFPTPSGSHLCCGHSNRLSILNPRTGHLLSTRDLGKSPTHDVQLLAVPPAPPPPTAEEDDSLPDYAHFSEIMVHAVHVASGVRMWSVEMDVVDGMGGPFLMYEDDVVFAARGGAVMALNAYTGRKIWEQKFKGFEEWDVILATLATRVNPISGGLGSTQESVLGVGIEGRILAIDKHTGVEMWRHKLLG